MTVLLHRDEVRLYHASWSELAESVDRVSTLIVDAPYSDKTHAGHDAGAMTADRAAKWAATSTDDNGNRAACRRYARKHQSERGKLAYAAWSKVDVDLFVEAWSPKTAGWFVSLTDSVLAPVWAEALERAGRYVFSPLACVEPGSRVRMSGDGPAQWSVWAVVARPRTKAAAKWRALPGAYVLPPGYQDKHASSRADQYVTGGKPLWLMERLVEDYSRPGDLVCDPCCGAGTTLLAALRTGRRALGCDVNEERASLAARRVSGMVQAPLFAAGAS